MPRFIWWMIAVGCWVALAVATIFGVGTFVALWDLSNDPTKEPIVWRVVVLVILAVAVPVGIFFGARGATRKARHRGSSPLPVTPPMPPVES